MKELICFGKLKDNFGGFAKNETDYSLLFENDSLNLSFVSYDKNIFSKGKSYNDKLYEGDTVEIFITLGKRNKYLELEVNPDGVQYAGVVENNNGQLNITYLPASPFFSRVDKKHDCWDCYMTIPIANLQRLGFQKDNAYFNLFRQDYDKDTLNLYALNPTNKSTFHDLDSFVKLEIQ